ncbi:MAG: hypothetical protein KC620_01095 [Myxococcales bacterium]|nr:hypothetical protein [Myxococcales bacterium]
MTLAFWGCAGQSEGISTGELAQPQLSGGLSGAIYDFMVDGRRVGTVLITASSPVAGYAALTEHWRFSPETLAEIGAGRVPSMQVETAWLWYELTDKLVAERFEAGSDGFVAWTEPRAFALESQTRRIKSEPARRRAAYRFFAPAPERVDVSASYFLVVEADAARPRMRWVLATESLHTYFPETFGDVAETNEALLLRDDSREILLVGASTLSRVDYAEGFSYIPTP